MNKEKYIKFCDTEKKMPIFSKYWWLDCVCGHDNWDVIIIEKGGNIMATMPYCKRKSKFNTTIISLPILTQAIGIYFKYPPKQKYYKKLSFEKEMIEKILEKLPNFDSFSMSFNYNYTNLLPFYWKGFKNKVNYTYIIKDITIEELSENFETDIRRRRRKASEAGIVVYESSDTKYFYELYLMTQKRQNRKILHSYNFIDNLYKKCKENNACKMYFAKDKNNNIIAGNFLVYDEVTVYYLMGGIDPTYKDMGGMDVVQYESIKFALENNKVFDFEGSMVESIEKYFRSFGAIQTPYYSISKTNSKLLKIRDCIKGIF